VLISDYSSCYIDYLALDRPVILYAYDMEDYLSKERNIFIPFSENKVGAIVKTRKEFSEALRNVCNDWADVIHKEGRKELKDKFFSEKLYNGQARAETLTVIKKMLDHNYKPNWIN
jgi:CDP-glycerol glycerophosphotransferase (TagB/SpsB family)